MWDNQHYCPISFHEPAVSLLRILTPEHTTSKNLSCLGKSLKPPLSQSKTKNSLKSRFSYSQTDQLSHLFLIKTSLKLESIQLQPTFNSASCNNSDIILPSYTAHPRSKFSVAISDFSPLA